jgi:hypothetical protein
LQRINQYEFYNLGIVLHPLSEYSRETISGDVFIQLFQAHTALEALLKGEPVALVVAKAQAEALRDAIAAAIPKTTKEMGTEERQKVMQAPLLFNAYLITENLKAFETVMAAELQTLDSYFISKKGIYSTADLIERAEYALPEAVRASMSDQAILDFKQAGKCLAFDLFTAAGFHSLRATDAAIRAYYAVFIGKPPQPKTRNWGAYIRVLKRCIADPKIPIKPDIKTLGLIDHIREMHRNPIIHPEDNLDEDKALNLFDLCKSAISAMTSEMSLAKQSAFGPGTLSLLAKTK